MAWWSGAADGSLRTSQLSLVAAPSRMQLQLTSQLHTSN